MNVERNLLGNFESDIVRVQNLLLSRANTRRNGCIKTIRNEILDWVIYWELEGEKKWIETLKKVRCKFEAQRRENSERLIGCLKEVGFAPSSPLHPFYRDFMSIKKGFRLVAGKKSVKAKIGGWLE